MVDEPAEPSNLIELTRVGTRPRWLVSLVQPETGGGKFEPGQLHDLETRENASALRVSGLDQPTFERLISGHGHRFSAIHFWKCPRVDDLSPLEDLPGLELVAYYWNQRATKLWDFRKTPRLRGLSFEDFTKIRRLDDLMPAGSLRELVFGDVVDRRSAYESLDPIEGLTGLHRLDFTPRTIADRRVNALGGLTNLVQLNCPTNLFTSRQYAWLRARLPLAGGSRVLQPLIAMGQPLGDKDVLLVGRGKPWLNSSMNRARIQKHVDRFERDVAEFRANPDLPPD